MSNLKDHISIKQLTEDEFWPLCDQHVKSVFNNDHSYDLSAVMDQVEVDKAKNLDTTLGKPFKLFLGAFDHSGKFVGWSWGIQERKAIFYMVNSGVLAEFRRLGVYRSLLKMKLEILSSMGFQIIYSRHNATNNGIIIPKLKAGFVISKMELDDKFGVLIHLNYYTNKERLKVMDYRSGQLKPDQRIREIFKI